MKREKGRPKSNKELKVIKTFSVHQSLIDMVFEKYPNFKMSEEITNLLKNKLEDKND